MRLYLTPVIMALSALAAPTAFAQMAAPFSMSPARSDAPAPSPQTAPSPSPVSPPVFNLAQPAAVGGPQQASPLPAAEAEPFQMGPGRTPAAPKPLPVATPPAAAQPQPARLAPAAARNTGRVERPVLPFGLIRLEGETDSRSWAFHVTQDEAASGTTLSLGYHNAVVVMPEASRLRVAVNGETVIDTPIASPGEIKRITAQIRPGLLRNGQNIMRMEVLQRHRTDCTIAATYELWTDVDSASTKLIFAEGTTKSLRSLEDLPAVGVDQAGMTTIKIVAPKIYRPEIRDRLLRLAQMIALRGRYAHPVIQVMESDPGPSPTGTIKVAMGVAGELRGLVAGVPEAATLQALAALMQDQNGGSTLLVTGPSWTDLDTAINIVGGPTVANGGVERTTVDTASWHWPEVPMAKGQRSFRFSDLGIATQEFSGRRLKAQFAINLPADFYATEYGEMILNLDAAYTSAIKPGSRVDIIVNGRISATRMFTSQGNVVRQHPIRVAMKNLRPGINYFAVETNLLTDADERCAPGETLSEAKRFVLFDSSRLDIPEFGRIGREPDLAVLSSGRFPYGDMPAAVVMARPDQAHYSATGTLLARMARSAGAPVRSYFATAATAEDRSVLFVGAVDQLPPGILSRVNVTENLRVTWPSTPGKTGQQVASADFSLPAGQLALDRPDMSSTDDVRRRWAETFQRRGIIQQTVGSVKDWLEQTFSLSLASLSLRENTDPPYEPPQRSTLMVAQSHVAGAGTWTLVTARTEEALAEEMARLSDPILWSQVSGRAVALDPREQKLEIQPISNFSFVQTQPLSLSNLRLVAANWMSANILQYALLMVAFCTLLGASTYLLLNRLGRSS